MKKTLTILLIICALFCLTACNTNNTSTNSTKDTEISIIDEHYAEALNLIDSKKYEEAYKELDSIKDSKIADELRSKFIIIKGVLLTQTLNIPNDKFGNKIGPFTINYTYDQKGNLIETDANDTPIINVLDAFNPYMRNVYRMNYHPYHEKLAYDDSNNLVSITGYNKSADKITYTVNFFYDESNRLDKVDLTYDMGTVTTFFEYDEKGTLKRIESSDSSFDDIVFNYDAFGNIIEDGTIYDEDGKITESNFRYFASEGALEGQCIWNYGDFYIYNE